MSSMARTGALKWLWLSAALVTLDQMSKLWIERGLELGEMRTLLPVFNIVRAHNPGAAFSFLAAASGWQRWLFTLIAAGVSLLLEAWMRRLPSTARLLPAGLALILGGAIGNLIDRLRYGHVIDFLDFHWGAVHFWAFNIADSGITVGAALLLLDGWLDSRRGSREPA
jgi:signal peptidase II